MPSFGILVLNYEQERQYYQELTKKGKEFSFQLYMFKPTDINPLTEKVHGLAYDETLGEWSKTIYSIPNFIYDRCFYKNRSEFKVNHPIINWLKNKRDITFLGYGLPNKWELYKSIATDDFLSPYIPETIQATSPKCFLNYLRNKMSILCKPESGSQGKGIFVLTEEDDESISLDLPKGNKFIKKSFASVEHCEKWLSRVLKLSTYLMQPYLNLNDENNHPFDIRVFIQKNKDGKWVERGRAIRKGNKNNIISNLHRGGEVHPYSSWLKQVPAKKRSFLNNEIDMIIEQATKCLDRDYSPLFEIGLDIGVAKDYSIWLLDTNSKPGRQSIIQNKKSNSEELYEAPFHYCNYLKSVQQQ